MDTWLGVEGVLWRQWVLCITKRTPSNRTSKTKIFPAGLYKQNIWNSFICHLKHTEDQMPIEGESLSMLRTGEVKLNSKKCGKTARERLHHPQYCVQVIHS